jgi:hypothetical protein
MTTLQILGASAVIAFGVLFVLAIIQINFETWHWCPKCRRYHSPLGILKLGQRPRDGIISGKSKRCAVCAQN